MITRIYYLIGTLLAWQGKRLLEISLERDRGWNRKIWYRTFT
jgi:hypothetical protein